MSDVARHPVETRIPLIGRRNKVILALGMLVQLAIVASLFWDVLLRGNGGWFVLFLALSLLVGFIGLCLVSLIRYGRTVLIVDAEGIWLESRFRKGIRWTDVVGYDHPHGDRTPTLRMRGRNGESVELPRTLGISVTSKEIAAIARELDRRLGPDGDRPPLPEIPDVLSARLHHYYGQVPAIELEPDVVYRYIDPKALADEVKSRAWGMSAAVSLVVPAYAMTTKFPAYGWIIAAATVLIVLFVALVVAQSLTLAYGFRDRFVRRGDAIWRIRNGRETRLVPSTSGPVRKIYDQPTTIHGVGPFAYRMAPQFLEPDV